MDFSLYILENVNATHITPIINKLEEAECKINIEKSKIKIIAPKKLKALDIKTMPYPGFPTDMQSIFGAVLSVAKGTSIITENIFEKVHIIIGIVKNYCHEIVYIHHQTMNYDIMKKKH